MCLEQGLVHRKSYGMLVVVISQQLEYSFEVRFHSQGTPLDSGRLCPVLIKEIQILALARSVHLIFDKQQISSSISSSIM